MVSIFIQQIFAHGRHLLGDVAHPSEGPIHELQFIRTSHLHLHFHSSACATWEPLTLVHSQRYLPSLILSSSLVWWDPGAVATVFRKRKASWLQYILTAREKSCADKADLSLCLYLAPSARNISNCLFQCMPFVQMQRLHPWSLGKQGH